MAGTAALRGTVYLDSNVPFYSILGDREYGEVCARVIRDIDNGTLRACASVLMLLEVANAIRKIGRGKEMEERTAALTSLPIRFIALSEPFVSEGIRLAREAGVSPYDGAHVATMLALNIGTVISADADFDRFADVERVDPREYIASRK